MKDYCPTMSDEMFEAIEKEIPITSKTLRSFYPKGKKNVQDPLESFWRYVAAEMKMDMDSLRVEDFIVTLALDQKLESMVGKYALKKVTYLTKGTPAYGSAVGMHMLCYGPVTLRHDKMKDNVIYYLPSETRLNIRQQGK